MSDHQCQCGHPLHHHAHGHRCLRNISAYRPCPCEQFQREHVEDPCQHCGHARTAHIYHEGPCRPGFVCSAACERFEREQVEPEPGCHRCGHPASEHHDDHGCWPSTWDGSDRDEYLCPCQVYVEPWTDQARQWEREERQALALSRRAAVLHPMMRPRPEYPEPHFDWPELGEIAAILGIDIVRTGDHQ